jgi:integrase
MWACTARLLKSQLAESGDLALLNSKGRELVPEYLNKDDKRTRRDAIRSMFERACRKAKVEGYTREGAKSKRRTFKNLRKTASQIITDLSGGIGEAGVRQFLGHSQYGAIIHYAGENYSQMDLLVAQMGKLLDLDSATPKTVEARCPKDFLTSKTRRTCIFSAATR